MTGTERRSLRPPGWLLLALVVPTVLLVLSACAQGVGSIPGVFATGDIRILGLEPDVRACVVREGVWLGILGAGFGDADDWVSGVNRAVFPPNPPGIVADEVQLVGDTLFVRVPDGATSGTLILDAGTSGVAEIPLTVEGGDALRRQGNLVGTICLSNPPPG